MKSVTKFAIGMSFLLGGVGCGHPKAPHVYRKMPSPPSPQFTPPTPSPQITGKKTESCSTKNDFSLDPERLIQRQQVDLTKAYQQVQRLDCDKKVVSDQIEVVSSPMSEIHLPSVKFPKGHDAAQFSSTDAFNRTTCSTARHNPLDIITGIIVLEKAPEIFWNMIDKVIPGDQAVPYYYQFTVNYSPTLFDTEVNKGDNYIDYTFYGKCLTEGVSKEQCTNHEVLEKGTLILSVNYQTKTLPGVKVVDMCEAKKKAEAKDKEKDEPMAPAGETHSEKI